MKCKEFISINDIHMIQNGNHNWECLKENDGTDVFRLQLGDFMENQEVLTVLYSKNTLSIREFNTTWSGGFTLFMEVPFENVSQIIESIVNAHKLTFTPLFHKNTVKVKNWL